MFWEGRVRVGCPGDSDQCGNSPGQSGRHRCAADWGMSRSRLLTHNRRMWQAEPDCSATFWGWRKCFCLPSGSVQAVAHCWEPPSGTFSYLFLFTRPWDIDLWPIVLCTPPPPQVPPQRICTSWLTDHCSELLSLLLLLYWYYVVIIMLSSCLYSSEMLQERGHHFSFWSEAVNSADWRYASYPGVHPAFPQIESWTAPSALGHWAVSSHPGSPGRPLTPASRPQFLHRGRSTIPELSEWKCSRVRTPSGYEQPKANQD